MSETRKAFEFERWRSVPRRRSSISGICIYMVRSKFIHNPTLAQLVERRTVVCADKSLGHWFESGRSDLFLLFYPFMGKFFLPMLDLN